MKAEEIARVCHEANRAITQIIRDVPVQPSWDDAPEEMKISSIRGVARVLEHPEITPAELHFGWMKDKRAAGWVWGPERDEVKKTHPAMVAYVELPEQVRKKDEVFRALINILKPSIE